MDDKTRLKIANTIEKYPNGKVCYVCGMLCEIEEFRFSKDKPFGSNCTRCNKLISVIATNHRKQKQDNTYCERRIESNKLQIRINELLLEHPEATDVTIAKLINHEFNRGGIK